jgi:nucleoside-diphosphate-sugar epimerase
VRAENFYAKGKAAETAVALKYRKEHKLPVFVARVFNPIGVGMNPRMLIPNVIAQVQACAAGESKSIEISRLDSLRDYIAVRDVALAYKALIEGEPSHDIYNVGSGVATSNSDLINLILDNWGLETRPKLVETADQPEPLAAAQADISRIKHDLKWSPRSTIEQSVKEICDASK